MMFRFLSMACVFVHRDENVRIYGTERLGWFKTSNPGNSNIAIKSILQTASAVYRQKMQLYVVKGSLDLHNFHAGVEESTYTIIFGSATVNRHSANGGTNVPQDQAFYCQFIAAWNEEKCFGDFS